MRMFLGSMVAIGIAFVNASLADESPDAVIRSAKSGPWSAPATWIGGKTPGPNDRVQIRAGHTVTFDIQTEKPIRFVHVSGTLTFTRDRDTRLDVGLIKIQPGNLATENGAECDAHVAAKPGDSRSVLEVGSAEQPIPAGKTALIRLHYIDGMDRQTCPAIVCCGGRMDFHGAPMNRTWVKLGATAKKDAMELTLAQPVTGWHAGDRIIITATNRHEDTGRNKNAQTEERTIAAIEGAHIAFKEPLTYAHLGDGEFHSEVANLSRNVIVESADPRKERGHTMYHRNSAGSISYAEFRHLGKEGVLGRYAIHYHLCGDTMRGSYVQGAAIWDSANRWLTIHGTSYLVARDCVGYQSLGHGYFLEDGTEVYNVLDRNLAVGAKRAKKLPKQALPFDQNDGAGFWWANSLNTFTRNVAAENGQYGFRYEATAGSSFKLVFPILQPDGSQKQVDIRTLPFVRFDDNEIHSTTGLYGCNLGEGVNRVGPDEQHPFIVRNLKIWDTHYGFRPQVPSLLVENLRLHRTHYGVYHPNYDHHVYRNVHISGSGTEPFNRGHDDLSVQYGPLTVDGLTFEACRSGGMPLVQISDDNPTGTAVTHFRNVKTVNWIDTSKARAIVNLGGGPRPQPKTEKGVPVYIHDWFGAGKHAMVVSTRSNEFKADREKFHADPPLTGDESRVAEVRDVPFPELLHPVDDQPPMTVITHVSKRDGKLVVRGTAADNGSLKRVIVNGTEATSLSSNFAEWEVTLDAADKITAYAEDAAGNVEKRPHVVTVR